MKDKTCVYCGTVIPEEEQVCPNCEIKELTDEEIVKALEYCTASPIDCDECPLIQGDEAHCSWILDIALDLIRRLQDDYSNLKERYVKVLDLNEKVIAEQKAEIEQLTKMRDDFRQEVVTLNIEKLELQKQVDELKEENKKLYKENTTLIAGSILERKDIAKYTAKEIYDKCIAIDKATGCKGFVCIEAIAELLKGKGVEVE